MTNFEAPTVAYCSFREFMASSFMDEFYNYENDTLSSQNAKIEFAYSEYKDLIRFSSKKKERFSTDGVFSVEQANELWVTIHINHHEGYINFEGTNFDYTFTLNNKQFEFFTSLIECGEPLI